MSTNPLRFVIIALNNPFLHSLEVQTYLMISKIKKGEEGAIYILTMLNKIVAYISH